VDTVEKWVSPAKKVLNYIRERCGVAGERPVTAFEMTDREKVVIHNPCAFSTD